MLADLLARALEAPLVPRDRPDARTAPERRDVIVVLGSTLTHRGKLTSILAERVTAAAALYLAGGGRWVIATGGVTAPPSHPSQRSEADAMAAALVAAGVPRDALVLEAAARNTADNARLTARELARLHARTAWIVTQPFHTRRAVFLFARAGIDARAWHITDSLEYADRRRALRWLIREYAAWVKVGLQLGRV